jgi:RNA polymerase sigma-70 factor (ECF subfamily)
MFDTDKNITNNQNLIAAYYMAHIDEVRGFISCRIGCDDTAKDVAQTVFERLLKSQKMISEITLPALVYTIARNLVNDYWRHRRAVDEYEHVIGYGICENGGEPSPESVYSISETIEILEQGIAHLSDRQRTVYKLSIYKGMKVQEISQTLNLNYKSVENSLGLARKFIRSYMQARLAV